ncbi:hypothetical protein KHC28_24260 [Ancylobacter sonchi]|uniref:hypothetical protein n=1 Tax=Ancylobacter TaxID=99 RepID=UPI001BD1F2B2|nr:MULTISPECIES: hypothetical protein [Ancylobacter]MBS7536761.1 hypothetical protein [Ancylobacter sonchi]MCB4770498.1 hypothetical protein [Ancylobacter sp. Lp-2]
MPILDHVYTAESATIPVVRVHAGSATFDIATLDEALSFALANPHPGGDYDGLIRRLESAANDDDVIEAGNAFLWWAEANNIVAGPVRC